MDNIKEKIKIELKKFLDRDYLGTISHTGKMIEEFTGENEHWLGFEIMFREADSDSWYEAHLSAYVHLAVLNHLDITFNHDVTLDFNDNTINDIVDTLCDLYHDASNIQKSLKELTAPNIDIQKGVEVEDVDREELAKQIIDGFTSGRLDAEDAHGNSKHIAWELKMNVWID